MPSVASGGSSERVEDEAEGDFVRVLGVNADAAVVGEAVGMEARRSAGASATSDGRGKLTTSRGSCGRRGRPYRCR